VVLLDTTVLSNFAHIERLDLLRLALPNAMTTSHVVAEFRRGLASGHLPTCDCGWLEVVELAPSEENSLAHVRLVLDDGEASCIAVALEREASLSQTILTPDGMPSVTGSAFLVLSGCFRSW